MQSSVKHILIHLETEKYIISPNLIWNVDVISCKTLQINSNVYMECYNIRLFL